MKPNNKIQGQNKIILRSLQTVAKIQDNNIGISHHCQCQRKQLQKIKDNHSELLVALDTSNKLLNRMRKWLWL